MTPARPVSVAVLGDGGWGTTLAIHLFRCGHRVRWWGHFPDYVQVMDRCRENGKFLPGVPIPRALPITADLRAAVEGAETIVLAVPSKFFRAVARQLKRRPRRLVRLMPSRRLWSNPRWPSRR